MEVLHSRDLVPTNGNPGGFACLRYRDPAWQSGTQAEADSEGTLFVPFHYFYFIETGSCLVGQTGLELSILLRAGMAGAHQHTQLLFSFLPCFLSDSLLLEPILSGVLTS